jgi:hypothetical protein
VSARQRHAPGNSSKKTRIVASTRGNQPIAGTDVYVGLNAYRMVPKK